MGKKIQFIKIVFIEGFELFRRSFLKTAAYQAIFKTAVLSIMIMLIGATLSALFDFAKISLLGDKEISTFFLQFKYIVTIGITIAILLLVHYIEKVGLILATSFVYRFKNISYLQIYKKAINKTPKVVLQKIKETKYLALLIPVVFFLWIITVITGMSGQISSFIYPLLIILIIIVAIIIYIRRIFSSYVVCLEPKESPIEFHKNTSREARIMKGWVLFIWYCIFIVAIVILFFLIFWIVKFSFDIIVSFTGPMAFFMAFAITSITFLIIFIPIILGSFRYSLYTTLYYKERKRQGKPFEIENRANFKISWIARHGKKFVALGIFVIFIVVSLLLTSSIQNQINNFQENLGQNEQEELSFRQIAEDLKKASTTGDKTKFIFDIVSIFLFDLAQDSLEDKNSNP
jgi:hypothetical protein